MNSNVWKNKAIERERLKRLLQEKVEIVREPACFAEWREYCIELREIEIALINAGARL